MYIKQFSKIFYYCPLNKSSSTQQFVSTVSNFLEELQRTPPIKVKISFNILSLWETLQSLQSFCKFTPVTRSLASNLAFWWHVVHSSAFECLLVLIEARSVSLVTAFISRSRINCSGLSMVYPLLFRLLYTRITPSLPLIASMILPRFHFDFRSLSSETNATFSVPGNNCPESSDFWCPSCNALRYSPCYLFLSCLRHMRRYLILLVQTWYSVSSVSSFT